MSSVTDRSVRNGIKDEITLYFRTNSGRRLFEYKVPVGPQ